MPPCHYRGTIPVPTTTPCEPNGKKRQLGGQQHQPPSSPRRRRRIVMFTAYSWSLLTTIFFGAALTTNLRLIWRVEHLAIYSDDWLFMADDKNNRLMQLALGRQQTTATSIRIPPVQRPRQELSRRNFNDADYNNLVIADNGGRRRWIASSQRSSSSSRNQRYDYVDGQRVPTGFDSPDSGPRPLNCNSFHELGFYTMDMAKNIQFLNHGYFRDAIRVDNHWVNNQTETVVLKRVRGESNELDLDSIETVRIEAAVMEELRSNPYILNLHGYCQMVAFVDYMPDGDILGRTAPREWRNQVDLDDADAPDPLNNYTVGEKIRLSLDMARGVASLHHAGYVHDDLKLSQFLVHPDGHVVLNDFNRAKHQYDHVSHKWRSWKNSGRYGDLRSPEEYGNGVLTRQIDIFSMGGIFYSVLTGLIPFDEVYTDQRMMKKFIGGDLPEIDYRYSYNPVLRELVKLIQDCWKYEPTQRPKASQLVKRLEMMQRMLDRNPEWDVQLCRRSFAQLVGKTEEEEEKSSGEFVPQFDEEGQENE